MRVVFVFSADELAPARVDEPFLDQAAALRAGGLAPASGSMVTAVLA